MLSIAHTLISIPFGIYFDSPLLIFISAFLFHLFADTLLHWNIYPEKAGRWFYPLAMLDVASGLSVAWLLLGTSSFFTVPILLAIFAGNLPDILQAFWDMAGSRWQTRLSFLQPAFIFHDKLQYETSHVMRGLVSQGVLVALAIFLSV